MLSGIIVIIINRENLIPGLQMIFRMAFSVNAVSGGLCGTITASMMNALRFGVSRGVFSNEAGMGSAAITAAAASSDDPVQQGYINMTGTFWDTLVVCTITGLCIASSGVLGITQPVSAGSYQIEQNTISIQTTLEADHALSESSYTYKFVDDKLYLTDDKKNEQCLTFVKKDSKLDNNAPDVFLNQTGVWTDANGDEYTFSDAGVYQHNTLVKGAPLTIKAFESSLGKIGGFLVSIGIVLFAFSTILGWEYQGEKALEYLLKTHKFDLAYRIVFCLIIYLGATTSLDIVWSFSDIANALMAIPNLISLLVLSNVIAKDVDAYELKRKNK